MKEKEGKMEDHKGLLGWSIGLAGLLFSVMQPIAGIIFGIVGVIVSSNQKKKYNDSWSKTGQRLSIIGLIVSIAVIIISLLLVKFLGSYLAQIQTAGLQ